MSWAAWTIAALLVVGTVVVGRRYDSLLRTQIPLTNRYCNKSNFFGWFFCSCFFSGKFLFFCFLLSLTGCLILCIFDELLLML